MSNKNRLSEATRAVQCVLGLSGSDDDSGTNISVLRAYRKTGVWERVPFGQSRAQNSTTESILFLVLDILPSSLRGKPRTPTLLMVSVEFAHLRLFLISDLFRVCCAWRFRHRLSTFIAVICIPATRLQSCVVGLPVGLAPWQAGLRES